ncbi:hypothetical protein CSOJ01_08520 [Colletotrichum sojae]|uniref:Uncharacterized protein n=1 Tax=Colletotrichum sojae TaxID=2175907 RepID=A0A8H6J6J8_9PEZI|nr:hypothetical protein CSOJ01_08520 [Colletotrichum sojae]
MASNTSSLSFPNWKPPAIDTIDFGSNCTIVKSFLETWFDVSVYEDVGNMTGNDQNVTFWVPETLQSQVTEEYFRQALPPNLGEVATYGEILEWEMSLRNAYARSVQEWVDLAADLNDTDSPPLDTQYFEHIIDRPSRWCHKEVCELSFEWEELGDVNGPGIFINYILLLIISGFYSAIAFFEAIRQLRRDRKAKGGYAPPGQPHPPGPHRSSFWVRLYRTTKQSFNGFADAAAVFSLALPFAIMTHHITSDTIMINSKDFILQLWVSLFSTCVSVWLYRIGACIRRVERAKLDQRRSKKQTLMTAIVLSLSMPGFVILVVFLHIFRNKMPFKFDAFWDDVCDNGEILTRRYVMIAAGILVGYCLIRAVVVEAVISCLASRGKKQILLPNGPPVSAQERRRRFQRLRNFYQNIRYRDTRYRRWMNFLGLFDIVFLGVLSTGILVYFHLFRQELSRRTGMDLFAKNWTLGQVLAVSTTIPVVLGFGHSLIPMSDAVKTAMKPHLGRDHTAFPLHKRSKRFEERGNFSLNGQANGAVSTTHVDGRPFAWGSFS